MDFKQIKATEVVHLAKVVAISNGGDLEKTLADLELIDNMLTILKSRSLLTKRSPTVRKHIDALVYCHLTGKRALWMSSRQKFHYID
jgi:hypothetical protein